MYANNADTNETAMENSVLKSRLMALWYGVSGFEDFEGLLFIREGNSIHVEADGERKGGNYLVTDGGSEDFHTLTNWAKAKVVCYTGRTDPFSGVAL